MFRAVDTSGDNKISLEEYKIAMGLMPPKQHKVASMRAVFRSFDLNGNGTIEREELDEVFRSMGQSLSPQEINRIIQMADKDSNGALNYEEFIEQVFGKQ
jgi:calmodulin